jgi:hypothetical protein
LVFWVLACFCEFVGEHGMSPSGGAGMLGEVHNVRLRGPALLRGTESNSLCCF